MLSLYDRVNQANAEITMAGTMLGIARSGSELAAPSTATHLLFVVEDPACDASRYQDMGLHVPAEIRSH